LQLQLQEIFDVSLGDDHLSWLLDANGVWTKSRVPRGVDSQRWFQQLALSRATSNIV
jgi:hypothetical protein